MRASEFLTVAECAAEVGVTDQTIINWIDAGKIKAKRFGPRCIRVAATEWSRFKNDAPSTAPAA